jgi:dihydrolipoamide dehydrogenase
MKYDIAILGGGPGGYVSAIVASKKGAKVAVIEKERLGGVCLNYGCIPTKVMINSARIYEEANGSEGFGIICDGIHFDYKKMLEHRNNVVDKLVSGIESIFKNLDIDVYKGEGKLINSREIEIDGNEKIKASNIILAMGSKSTSLPNLEIDGENILDSRQILNLDKIPEEIIIVGAGAIGCEFAYFFSTIGIKVRVIEIMERILPFTDKRLSSVIHRKLKNAGVEFYLNTSVKEIKKHNAGIRAKLVNNEEVEGRVIFISVGRKPRLEAVSNLADLEIDNGYIVADLGMRTSVDGVYAIGDLVNSPMLAHVASYEGEVAVGNILGEAESVRYDCIAKVVYTHPELTWVGLTEEDLKNEDKEYQQVTMNFYSNGRALGVGAEDSVIRIFVDNKGIILGASLVAPNASEMIELLSFAIRKNMKANELEEKVFNHPSFSETIGEAIRELGSGAIHRI